MNSANKNIFFDEDGPETMSRFLSSMGCSWDTTGTSCCDAKSFERISIDKLTYPSLSLANDTCNNEHDDGEGGDTESCSSSHQREAVQTKASNLMSRKRIYSKCNNECNAEELHLPQRIMLENILDSFDQLVDARIRAYARILSNHVQVLWESNNTRGARIAEYKLQTLLEFAANHLLFDSISTEFKSVEDENDVCNGTADDSTSIATTDRQTLSQPIELNVEIRSPRFLLQDQASINSHPDADGDDSTPPHRRHQGILRFRAGGKVQVVNRIIIGQDANDTSRCLVPQGEGCRNKETHVEHSSSDGNRVPRNSSFCNDINIDIDSNALLSQMMEEASKVVAMAVELTNLAWTNNPQKQEEIDMMAENNISTANLIVDDEDYSVSREQHGMTGKRSRCDDHPDTHRRSHSTMSKKVSETSLLPHAQVICDDYEHIEEPRDSNDFASATITNLHVLEQDSDRKARYSVSDPSQESSSSRSDPPLEQNDEDDECYDQISAKRVCDIVDFVLAGDIVPIHFTPNKKLRTK